MTRLVLIEHTHREIKIDTYLFAFKFQLKCYIDVQNQQYENYIEFKDQTPNVKDYNFKFEIYPTHINFNLGYNRSNLISPTYSLEIISNRLPNAWFVIVPKFITILSNDSNSEIIDRNRATIVKGKTPLMVLPKENLHNILDGEFLNEMQWHREDQ